MPPNNTTAHLPSSLQLPSFEALGNARLWFGLFEFHMARENIFDETMLFSFVKQYFPADLTLSKLKTSPKIKKTMLKEDKVIKTQEKEKSHNNEDISHEHTSPDKMDTETLASSSSSLSSSSSSSPTMVSPVADQVIDWLELSKHAVPYTHFKQVMLAYYRSDNYDYGNKRAMKRRVPKFRRSKDKKMNKEAIEVDEKDDTIKSKPLQVTPPDLQVSDSLLNNFTGFSIEKNEESTIEG